MKKNSMAPSDFEQLPFDFPPRIIIVPRVSLAVKQYSIRATMPRQPMAESIRLRIFEYDDWQCRYCGEPADVIDHIIPWTYGGTDDDDNLVAACIHCNAVAGSNVFDNFNSKREFIRQQREKRRKDGKIREEKCTCVVCGNPIYVHERQATRFLCTECNLADLGFERTREMP